MANTVIENATGYHCRGKLTGWDYNHPASQVLESDLKKVGWSESGKNIH